MAYNRIQNMYYIYKSDLFNGTLDNHRLYKRSVTYSPTFQKYIDNHESHPFLNRKSDFTIKIYNYKYDVYSRADWDNILGREIV